LVFSAVPLETFPAAATRTQRQSFIHPLLALRALSMLQQYSTAAWCGNQFKLL